MVLVVLAGLVPAQAQRSRRLDCPGAPRSSSGAQLALPPVYWEGSAGVAQPFLYRNGAATGSNFSFRAKPIPYAGITGYVPLTGRLEVFAGASLTMQWQGLRFSHTGAAGDLRIDSYAGAWVASLPVGVRYRVSPALRLSAGPYLSFSTHREGDASNLLAPDRSYVYQAPDDPLRVNGGVRVAADLRLSRRLGAVVSGAADAGMATPSGAVADLGSDGAYRGTLQPYLVHLGLGLTYRFRPDDE